MLDVEQGAPGSGQNHHVRVFRHLTLCRQQQLLDAIVLVAQRLGRQCEAVALASRLALEGPLSVPFDEVDDLLPGASELHHGVGDVLLGDLVHLDGLVADRDAHESASEAIRRDPVLLEQAGPDVGIRELEVETLARVGVAIEQLTQGRCVHGAHQRQHLHVLLEPGQHPLRLEREGVHPLLAPVEAPVVAGAEKGEESQDRDPEHRRQDGAGPVLPRALRLAGAHPLPERVEVDGGGAHQQRHAHQQVAADPAEVRSPARRSPEERNQEAQQREDDGDEAKRAEQCRKTGHLRTSSQRQRTDSTAVFVISRKAPMIATK